MDNLKMLSTQSVHDCYDDDAVDRHHEEVRQIYERYADGHAETDVDVVSWLCPDDDTMRMLKIRGWGLYDTDTALNEVIEAMPVKDGVDAYVDKVTGGLVIRAYYHPYVTDAYFTFK